MAKRLELELAKPNPALPLWTWMGMIILAVSLIFAAFTWRANQSLQSQHAQIESQLQALHQVRQTPNQTEQKAAVVEVNPEQLQVLQLTANDLATPWNKLFEALEKSSIKDIATLGLQPDSRKQQVIISGEAKNYASVLAYIDSLSKQPMLADVYLQKHAVNEADKDKPVRFSIFARWLIDGNGMAV